MKMGSFDQIKFEKPQDPKQGAEKLEGLNQLIENAESPEEKEKALGEAVDWENKLDQLEMELGLDREAAQETLVQVYEGKVELEQALQELAQEEPELKAAIEAGDLDSTKGTIVKLAEKISESKKGKISVMLLLAALTIGAIGFVAFKTKNKESVGEGIKEDSQQSLELSDPDVFKKKPSFEQKNIIIPAGWNYLEQEPRDLEQDFDLGMQLNEEAKAGILSELINSENNDVNLLAGGKYYNLDQIGIDYKQDAFAQMAEKYGKARIDQLMDFLVKIFPERLKQKYNEDTRDKILTSYGRELPRIADSSHDSKRPRLNQKLYNIASYLEEGGLEKLEELVTILQTEGYDYKFEFSWSPSDILEFLSNSEERQALVEYTKLSRDPEKGLAASFRLHHKLGKERYDAMSYQEKLKMLKEEIAQK